MKINYGKSPIRRNKNGRLISVLFCLKRCATDLVKLIRNWILMRLRNYHLYGNCSSPVYVSESEKLFIHHRTGGDGRYWKKAKCIILYMLKTTEITITGKTMASALSSSKSGEPNAQNINEQDVISDFSSVFRVEPIFFWLNGTFTSDELMPLASPLSTTFNMLI